MKTIILISILLFPLSLLANPYPITITNSGATNNLVIIPTTTAYPCFSAPEGLSISGDFTTIPPNTSYTYNFALPSNLLLECANVISAGMSGNGTTASMGMTNKYAIGTTLTQAIYNSPHGLEVTYSYQSLDKSERYYIGTHNGDIPPYMIFSGDNHSVSINADEMPQS